MGEAGAPVVTPGQDEPRKLGDRQTGAQPLAERVRVTAPRAWVDEREHRLAATDQIDGNGQGIVSLASIRPAARGSVPGSHTPIGPSAGGPSQPSQPPRTTPDRTTRRV